MRLKAGFISTRIAGTDGVSLEIDKWARILKSMDIDACYFAGELDTPPEASYLYKKAHFMHPATLNLHKKLFGDQDRDTKTTQEIKEFAGYIKTHIYKFLRKFKPDVLIPENCLAIPVNIPLGIALTEVIAETNIPTIAHHHDFFWERKRFLTNCVWDYLNMSFPPHLPSISHVVINSSGDNQLSLRTGISATLIPNVMDFENPPEPQDDYTQDICKDFGIRTGEYFFLQPTRIVQRKLIEHAVELVSRLHTPTKLVITHASGDEGNEYETRIRNYSELLRVNTAFLSDIVDDDRGTTKDGRKIYTLEDVYPHADFVTYPSVFEGFGNAFLEAIFYKKPIVVNSYSIYTTDIKPKGFRVVEFDNFVTEQTVQQVEDLLNSPAKVRKMVEHNFELGRKHFSYSVVRNKLRSILTDHFGIG